MLMRVERIAWPRAADCWSRVPYEIWALERDGDTFVPMKPITLDEVLQLPVPERIRIVEAIWDSIADTPEALELSDEQRAELDRRLADLEKNPDGGSRWAEVRDRVWRGK